MLLYFSVVVLAELCCIGINDRQKDETNINQNRRNSETVKILTMITGKTIFLDKLSLGPSLVNTHFQPLPECVQYNSLGSTA